MYRFLPSAPFGKIAFSGKKELAYFILKIFLITYITLLSYDRANKIVRQNYLSHYFIEHILYYKAIKRRNIKAVELREKAL